MKWREVAPSNIALIKYMGKKNQTENIPANSSISWTLNHLISTVELELTEGENSWEPLASDFPITLNEKGKIKFLGHLERMKQFWGVDKNFIVRSANNFPADCGIASSASSFAALTKVCAKAFSDISGKKDFDIPQQALLSAKGSGSSCRSFYNGFVSWQEHGISQVNNSYHNIFHQVVIASGSKKDVSSSEAHKKVMSSLNYLGRSERAEQRYQEILQALKTKNWQQIFIISWNEFWDMHALFETALPPFSYMNAQSFEILNQAKSFWSHGDGPVVTMDAGANVHLLWREDQKTIAMNFEKQNSHWKFISGSTYV